MPVASLTNKTTVLTPASGLRRGVVVFIHGLGGGTPPAIPIPIVDIPTGILPQYMLTLANSLTADGWVVIQPPYSDDFHVVSNPQGVYNDVNSDAGHGSQYLTQTLHWWDHVIAYIKATYGNWPVTMIGWSWGGWHALQIAANRMSTLTAYVVHHPVTILSNLAVNYPPDFRTGINTTGLDAGAHILDAVTIPGNIGWGTTDGVVGYNLLGTGGTPVSNTTDIYNNAVAASRPVTSNPQSGSHTFTTTDAGVYAAWFTSTVDPLCPKTY